MTMCDLIIKKKNGIELSKEEIQFIVDGITDGSIPDYQISSFAMAVCLRSMTEEETFYLTDAMAHSGDLLDLSPLGEKTVDKHSTGGVGDKTSLIIAPIMASAGAVMAKMSGRGLGHTGGTVDKLSSIPGYRVELTDKEFMEQAKKCNVVMIGQTGNLTPADKRLYAIRDVSGTVDSIPLIASSVMSKKIAAGAKNIVLDVKTGSGAFMKTKEEALSLAKEMVKIGKYFKRNIKAVITDMSVPLGTCIGNALEVREAIEVLKCRGDQTLTEVCLYLCSQILSLAHGISEEEGMEMAKEALYSGKALQKFEEWILEEGATENPVKDEAVLKLAPITYEFKAKESGFISKLDALSVGKAACALGAGREKADDVIDLGAGIQLNKVFGDMVKEGELLATLYVSDESKLKDALALLSSAYEFTKEKPYIAPHILDTVS